MSGQFHVCGCENIKSALLHRSEISIYFCISKHAV